MRYFQPKEYQYISQYTPEMAAMDYKKGQDLLKEEDAFTKNLFDVSNNYLIKNPGHLSKQEDVDKANNFMKSNLDLIASEATNGKISAREAINKLNTLTNFYKSDKSMQGLLMDSQATWGENGFESKRSTGKLKQGVGAFGPYGKPGSLYIDDSNQLHAEKVDAKYLADAVGGGAYGVELPKNTLDKYKDFYSYIKPETIAEEIERAGFRKTKDGQNYVHSTNKGSFTKEQVTREALRNLAAPYVNSNIETNPDYEYDRRINMTDTYGFDVAKEKEINKIVDSYPGFYKKELKKDEAKINPFGSSDGDGTKSNLPGPQFTFDVGTGKQNIQEEGRGNKAFNNLESLGQSGDSAAKLKWNKDWDATSPAEKTAFITQLKREGSIKEAEAIKNGAYPSKYLPPPAYLQNWGSRNKVTWDQIKQEDKEVLYEYLDATNQSKLKNDLQKNHLLPMNDKDGKIGYKSLLKQMKDSGFIDRYNQAINASTKMPFTAINEKSTDTFDLNLYNAASGGGKIKTVADLKNSPSTVSNNKKLYNLDTQEWENISDLDVDDKAEITFGLGSSDNNLRLLKGANLNKDWSLPIVIAAGGNTYIAPGAKVSGLIGKVLQDSNHLADLKLAVPDSKNIKLSSLQSFKGQPNINADIKFDGENYYLSSNSKSIDNMPRFPRPDLLIQFILNSIEQSKNE